MSQVYQIIVSKTPFMIVGVTTAELKHCGKMSDAKKIRQRTQRGRDENIS